MNYGIDILAVGDVVTDAFIRLGKHEAEVDQDVRDKHPLLCMTYGTKIPFEEVVVVPAVGNSANAAVAAAKLDLRVAFYSNIGDDQTGKDILRALHKQKISTEYITIHDDMKSNYHYVLWYGADRTILIKHEEYRYHWPKISQHNKPQWIYLSSIGESALGLHDDIADYLAKNDDVKLAFQPGTFQMRLGSKRLKKLYGQTYVLACNKQEAQQITESSSDDMKTLFKGLHALGPKIVVITDGPAGSFASDGSSVWSMPIYPDPAPPVERTGAGDSYTATFVAALAKGKDVPTAMAWGSINSMNVVQHIGAQAGLLHEDEIKKFLSKAPKNFVAHKEASK